MRVVNSASWLGGSISCRGLFGEKVSGVKDMQVSSVWVVQKPFPNMNNVSCTVQVVS